MSQANRSLGWSLLLCLLLGVYARAQETVNDYADADFRKMITDPVTTASKISEPLLETPVAVTVIDRALIETYGVTAIPELLRDVVGLSVSQYDHGDHVVGIRGNFAAPVNNVLVLLDGKNVYQNVYGFTLWNAIPVSVEEIERIEIIRGPASSLYGANAAMGVINIITRTDSETEAAVAAGSFGIRHATARIPVQKNGLKLRAGLTYRAIGSFSPAREDTAHMRPEVFEVRLQINRAEIERQRRDELQVVAMEAVSARSF